MNTRSILIIISLAVLTVFCPAVRAAAGPGEVVAEFAAANKLYAEGKFAEAASAYENTIQQTAGSGNASPALYFNAGNAEFKLGRFGRAIAAYRRAALLNPRDSEILGNLDFARNQVQGSTVRPSRWQSWVGVLTLNEGTVLTAVWLWLWLALLTVRQLQPALVARLRGLTLAALVATVLSGTILAMQASIHFSSQTAVVTTANAQARSGPFDDAQPIFAPHDGVELSVLDRHDDWLQVADGSGKIGWLPRKALELVPGA